MVVMVTVALADFEGSATLVALTIAVLASPVLFTNRESCPVTQKLQGYGVPLKVVVAAIISKCQVVREEDIGAKPRCPAQVALQKKP